MEKFNLENKILDKIEKENIKPKSIWYFLVKDYSLWLAVLFSILFVGLSIAPIIFFVQNLELDNVKHISGSPLIFLLKILPYPFIILSFIFIFLAKMSWQRTKKGYKFEGKTIVGVSAILSLIFGIILNTFTFGKILDEKFDDPLFHSYKSVEQRKIENWSHPEEGRLIGFIENVSTSSFTISNLNPYNTNPDDESPATTTWKVNFDDETPGSDLIFSGKKVRVIVTQNSDQEYEACLIFPAERPPQPQIKNNQNKPGPQMDDKKKRLSEDCKTILDKGRANFHPTKFFTPNYRTQTNYPKEINNNYDHGNN